MQSIGAHGACRERGSQAANGTACGVGTATLQAAVRTTRTACAPWMDQRICWDLFMRRLTSVFANPSVVEVPIAFVERSAGESKMSGVIVAEALWRVTEWGIRDRARDLILTRRG